MFSGPNSKTQRMTNQFSSEVNTVLESSHMEWIENREREAIEHDEAIVRRFLAAKLRAKAASMPDALK
jgi:hypothetical protein